MTSSHAMWMPRGGTTAVQPTARQEDTEGKATFLPFAAIAAGDIVTRAGDEPVKLALEVTVPKPPDRRRRKD